MAHAIKDSGAPPALLASGALAQQERRLELFRGVVRSLARDAARALNEARFNDDLSAPAVHERLDVVDHYLSYLLRLCDGRV